MKERIVILIAFIACSISTSAFAFDRRIIGEWVFVGVESNNNDLKEDFDERLSRGNLYLSVTPSGSATLFSRRNGDAEWNFSRQADAVVNEQEILVDDMTLFTVQDMSDDTRSLTLSAERNSTHAVYYLERESDSPVDRNLGYEIFSFCNAYAGMSIDECSCVVDYVANTLTPQEFAVLATVTKAQGEAGRVFDIFTDRPIIARMAGDMKMRWDEFTEAYKTGDMQRYAAVSACGG